MTLDEAIEFARKKLSTEQTITIRITDNYVEVFCNSEPSEGYRSYTDSDGTLSEMIEWSVDDLTM